MQQTSDTGYLEIRIVSDAPIPWDILVDHLNAEVIVGKDGRDTRLHRCWIHPHEIARTLRGLSTGAEDSSRRFALIETSGVSFRLGPALTAESNGPTILVHATTGKWRIRLEGTEAARVAEALRGLQYRSQFSLLSHMTEFAWGLDPHAPILIDFGSKDVSIQLTPASLYDSLFATAQSMFEIDFAGRTAAPPSAGSLWSDEERRLRDHYRQMMQEAFDQFADHFSIDRKEIPIAEGPEPAENPP